MKMFLIVYCDAADEDVIDTFKKGGIMAYTKMREVRGAGDGYGAEARHSLLARKESRPLHRR